MRSAGPEIEPLYKRDASLSPSPSAYRSSSSSFSSLLFSLIASVSQREGLMWQQHKKLEAHRRHTQPLHIVCIFFLLLLSLTSSSASSINPYASAAAPVTAWHTPQTAIPKCTTRIPNDIDWLIRCGHIAELSFTASSQMPQRPASFGALGVRG